jgi:hypothetical protein
MDEFESLSHTGGAHKTRIAKLIWIRSRLSPVHEAGPGVASAPATAETRHFESLCNNKHLLNRRYGARLRLRASILAKRARAASSVREALRKPAMP